MVKGSCVCGEYTYEVDGSPTAVTICHCIPCQKTAGLNGSYNWLLQDKQLKRLSGTVKNYTRKGDSGKNIRYSLCETCGTIISGSIEAIPGASVLKAGTLDDKDLIEKEGKPAAEIYTKNRPSWCTEWPGVEQKTSA